MTTAILVCEGRCNGEDVKRYDMACKQARDRMAIAEVWLMLARKFVHTLHEAITEYDYRCTVCGASRKYGIQPLPVSMEALRH